MRTNRFHEASRGSTSEGRGVGVGRVVEAKVLFGVVQVPAEWNCSPSQR